VCKWLLKQTVYSAALGCAGLLACAVQPSFAAEWSVTPVYSSSVDYDDNRRLSTDARGTGSAILSADLQFKRALEDSQISIEPRYTFRRYTDSTLGNGDDRGITAGLARTFERSTLQATVSYLDQSTLTTELLETGIVTGDTHRRQTLAGGTWSWSQTERRQLITQLSYVDVSYYGQGRAALPGYRYPSGSVGERFLFSENGSITVSGYGSELSSDARGGSSHEYGLQAELIYFLSERTHFDGSFGESSRLLTGQSSHGTDVNISLTRDMPRGNLALTYTRSLVPYGIGYLVERQQATASGLYQISPYLNVSVSLLRIQNNEAAVRLGLDRRSINNVLTGLNWHPTETWSFGLQLSGIRTQTPVLRPDHTVSYPAVNEWRTVVTLTWTPLPRASSW
jgi:hypothetical protein